MQSKDLANNGEFNPRIYKRLKRAWLTRGDASASQKRQV
jgi:hypothetical protein